MAILLMGFVRRTQATSERLLPEVEQKGCDTLIHAGFVEVF